MYAKTSTTCTKGYNIIVSLKIKRPYSVRLRGK